MDTLNRYILIIVWLLFISIAQAQMSYRGKYQRYIKLSPRLQQQEQLSSYTSYYIPPPIDITSHKNHTLLKSYQFAKSIPVSISFDESLSIQSFINENNDWHWKIKLHSHGALSLSLIFDVWWIPKDTEVYVYNENQILGAFKSFPSNKKSKKFATTPLKGDSITLEYFSPAYVKELPQITLSKLVYGYRPIPGMIEKEELAPPSNKRENYQQQFIMKRKRRPQSGRCNVDLSCDIAGTDWSKEADAVAILLTNENQVYCTGVLLNNAENDGRQLLLTAYHCTGTSDPETDIIMFNHQRRSCNGYNGYLSTRSDTLHGLNYLAGSAISDYALYEIQEPIPKAYNVYLAGWTTNKEPVPPLVGIHHPKGDFKKLSIYNGHLSPTCWSECPIKDHWKVERWTRGTTEPGSSGSPLFDASHRVVGQLHGGSASCWNKNGYDVYGSFEASWSRGLSPYLDPKNRTSIKPSSGQQHINGIYFNKIKQQH